MNLISQKQKSKNSEEFGNKINFKKIVYINSAHFLHITSWHYCKTN